MRERTSDQNSRKTHKMSSHYLLISYQDSWLNQQELKVFLEYSACLNESISPSSLSGTISGRDAVVWKSVVHFLQPGNLTR